MGNQHNASQVQAWHTEYDVKDQCGRCESVVKEKHMVACTGNRPGFPAAHNCPVFRLKRNEE